MSQLPPTPTQDTTNMAKCAASATALYNTTHHLTCRGTSTMPHELSLLHSIRSLCVCVEVRNGPEAYKRSTFGSHAAFLALPTGLRCPRIVEIRRCAQTMCAGCVRRGEQVCQTNKNRGPRRVSDKLAVYAAAWYFLRLASSIA